MGNCDISSERVLKKNMLLWFFTLDRVWFFLIVDIFKRKAHTHAGIYYCIIVIVCRESDKDCIMKADTQTWLVKLQSLLPLLGHRNWILITDSAYPFQNSSGIETVFTEQNHLTVLETVFHLIEDSMHVRAEVLLDQELEYVNELDAPGIGQYRTALYSLFENCDVMIEPHEDIIRRIDLAGQTFKVLLLKTTMTIPYTSVFLRLDCAYWNDAAEERLRQRLLQEV